VGNTEVCEEVEVWSKNSDYGMKKYMRGGGGLFAFRQKFHVVFEKKMYYEEKRIGRGGGGVICISTEMSRSLWQNHI